MTTQNADTAELDKFNRLARRWWEPDGEFKTLHVINPRRLNYITDRAGPLRDRSVLDVGCGGGILAESMAKAGARVTGLDLAEDALAAAVTHAEENAVAVDYRAQSVERCAEESPGRFDTVTCMEMLEHVPDPAAVIDACARLCKPGGHVFFSTINRTPKAFALAIVGAEYLAGLLPRGTHEYARFIRPSELAAWTRAAELEVVDISGMHYNALNHTCRLAEDVAVNYLMHCQKPQSGH